MPVRVVDGRSAFVVGLRGFLVDESPRFISIGNVVYTLEWRERTSGTVGMQLADLDEDRVAEEEHQQAGYDDSSVPMLVCRASTRMTRGAYSAFGFGS